MRIFSFVPIRISEIVYFIFDLLHLKDRDLLDLPLSERRKQLEHLATNFTNPGRLNPSFHVSLADFTASVQKLGLEGIIAKRSDSIYIPGKESAPITGGQHEQLGSPQRRSAQAPFMPDAKASPGALVSQRLGYEITGILMEARVGIEQPFCIGNT